MAARGPRLRKGPDRLSAPGAAQLRLQQAGISATEGAGAEILSAVAEIDADRKRWPLALKALNLVERTLDEGLRAPTDEDLVALARLVDTLRRRLEMVRLPKSVEPKSRPSILQAIKVLDKMRAETGRGEIDVGRWWPPPPDVSPLALALIPVTIALRGETLAWYWQERRVAPTVEQRVKARVRARYGAWQPGEQIMVAISELGRAPQALEPADDEARSALESWRRQAHRRSTRRGPGRNVAVWMALLSAERAHRRGQIHCEPHQIPEIVAALLYEGEYRGEEDVDRSLTSFIKRVKKIYQERVIGERQVVEAGAPRSSVSRRT